MRFGGFALVAMCGVSAAVAQVDPRVAQSDPAVAVREVAQRIESEMQEIDRLLRASRPPTTETTDTEDRLANARWGQRNVVRDIDELLDELHNFCCTCPGGT